MALGFNCDAAGGGYLEPVLTYVVVRKEGFKGQNPLEEWIPPEHISASLWNLCCCMADVFPGTFGLE